MAGAFLIFEADSIGRSVKICKVDKGVLLSE
jgi:hypothetical protein